MDVDAAVRETIEQMGASIAQFIETAALGKQPPTVDYFQRLVGYVYGVKPEQVVAVAQPAWGPRDHFEAKILLTRPIQQVEMTLRVEP